MGETHEYRVGVRWTGDRRASVEADGLPTFELAAPPEFGGSAGRWTPEHLFVAAASACVLFTFVAVADASRLEPARWTSRATGRLEKVPGEGYRFVAVDVDVELAVRREEDVERARRLVEKAEKACLVSRSLATPVRLRARVEVEGTAAP